MLELIAGTLVAAATVALVLEPLIRPRAHSSPADESDDFIELEEVDSPKVRALLALREIEFDRATGKLSEDDYKRLKTRYANAAIEAIDSEQRDDAADVPATTSEDAAERFVASRRSRDKRACTSCGVRPEPGAVFCSHCGRSLLIETSPPRCWMCGAGLETDARFCGECGLALSA